MSDYQHVIQAQGLPSSPDAERAILGSILLENEHFYEAAERLSPEAFSLEYHRRIFARMQGLIAGGHAVDAMTMLNCLRDSRELDSIGGAAYLASLTDGLPRRVSIASWVQIVNAKAKARAAVTLANDLALRAAEQSEDVNDLIAETDRKLLAIAAESASEPDLKRQTVAEMDLMHRQSSSKDSRILTTGIAGLDMLTDGLAFREVAFLAARPGQGKTWLICQLLWRYCMQGIPCHFFTFEMASGALLRRLWALVSGVSYRSIRRGWDALNREEQSLVHEAAGQIAEWPLVLDDAAQLTVDQLIARCRISKRRHKTQFFALDYLQKMRFTRDVKYRHIDVSDAAIGIAKMTKEEDVVFLAISSLTNKNGRDRNQPPTLADFRQSGDIEYEASTVIFIHREVDPETERLRNEGELIVAKSRNADMGAVRIHWNSESLMFEEKSYGRAHAV